MSEYLGPGLAGIPHVKVNLMVCDPLHRRKVQLPPIPDDLVSATWDRGLQEFHSFLDAATDTEKETQDLSFRVISVVQHQHNFVAFHFSSVTGKWRCITFNRPVLPLVPYVRFQIYGRRYAHGCFFWRISHVSSSMVMLDMHDMELSLIDLPPGVQDNLTPTLSIVEAGDGTIGLFTIISDDKLQLYCKSLQGTEWHHERIIPLPKVNSYWSMLDAAAGYVLLEAVPRDSSLFAMQESQYFTLNLETLLVERLGVSIRHIRGACLYASSLLPFSQPSI